MPDRGRPFYHRCWTREEIGSCLSHAGLQQVAVSPGYGRAGSVGRPADDRGAVIESCAILRLLGHDADGRGGHDTVADIYPYLARQTGLSALLVPAWAVEGGPRGHAKAGFERDFVELMQFLAARLPATAARRKRIAACIRFFGTYPRVLGYYVRETKALTLEDAIRKMMGLPANIIGMTGRGFLAVGMAADITVFDAAKILDHATYEQPTLRSEGVRWVLVNGRKALRDGEVTRDLVGQVLRRREDMPSSVMRTHQTRSLWVKSKDISLDLSQKPGTEAQFPLRGRRIGRGNHVGGSGAITGRWEEGEFHCSRSRAA